jgi:DNA-binding transcriptional regulator YhcF (GntR family)
MIMRSEVLGTLPTLGLSQSAYALLAVLIDQQEPGGKILQSQAELAESLGVHPNVCSRAMKILTDVNVVLRPSRNRYQLHPLIASYSTVEDMNQAIAEALDAMQDGELQRIAAPAPKRHLAAVS